MADNTTLDPGSGGDTIATDDIGGVKYQRVKLTDGTADSATAIASGGGVEAAALRVTIASDSTGVVSIDDNGSSVTVDGAVSLAAAIPAGSNNIGDVDIASALPAGSNNIGDVDVLTVPADPFGANADAAATAGSTGSIQAKLRLLTSQLDAIKTSVETLDNAIGGSEMQVDVVGALPAGTNNIGDVDVLTLPSIPAGANTIGTVNLGTAAVTNAGTFAVQDSEKLADDAAFTVGTTKLTPVGMLADQASTDPVNEGDIGAPRITLTRQQIVTVAPSADTEGLAFVMDIDLDETETQIKATAGKLYGWYLYNDGATEVYVKIYNATTATVVVGTTVPDLTIPVPAGSAANVEFTNGIGFSTAITAAATTGVATADASAPAANQVVANFFYQ